MVADARTAQVDDGIGTVEDPVVEGSRVGIPAHLVGPGRLPAHQDRQVVTRRGQDGAQPTAEEPTRSGQDYSCTHT